MPEHDLRSDSDWEANERDDSHRPPYLSAARSRCRYHAPLYWPHIRLFDRTHRCIVMSGTLSGASRLPGNPLTLGCRWHHSCLDGLLFRPWRSGRPARQGKVGLICPRRRSTRPTRAITRRRRTTRPLRTTICRRRITTSRVSTIKRRRMRRPRRSTASRPTNTRRPHTNSHTNRERVGSAKMSTRGGSPRPSPSPSSSGSGVSFGLSPLLRTVMRYVPRPRCPIRFLSAPVGRYPPFAINQSAVMRRPNGVAL